MNREVESEQECPPVEKGLRAAVVNPSAHVGGIVSGGLGASDVGNADVIGGLTREFFKKVGKYYGKASPVFAFEPHVAERVFTDMLKESKIDVFNNCRLKESGGVSKDGTSILSITTENGSVFKAKVFIDSSYEGDLMAASGVSYTVGRESQAKYQESLAGVRPFYIRRNFRYNLNGYSQAGGLLPCITEDRLPGIGSGDKKLPAYNFRLCLSDDPANMTPFTKPQHYDPSNYELLLKWLFMVKQTEGNRDLKIGDVLSLCKLSNNEYDANNIGAFSSDYIGADWDYPDAGYKQRDKITEQHKEYLQGLLFFLSTDQRVPAELRKDMKSWGLAKDEFQDNGNWPNQLYIREGRRMVGDFVLTQQDLQHHPQKSDTVGMGSYPIDSHNVQRIATADGRVENEGEILETVRPYEIPYRCITPKKSEASNLLVTVCVSASHVAYSSLRMEPQYMILGQAAGAAAKLAIEEQTAVQNISVTSLQSLLKSDGSVMSLNLG